MPPRSQDFLRDVSLGLIRLFKVSLFLLAQDLATHFDSLVDSLDLAESNDGTSDALQALRKGHVRDGAPMLGRDCLDALDGLTIRSRQAFVVQLALVCEALCKQRAGQISATKGSPWNHTDSCLIAKPDHLSFLLAVEHVVLVLHADELGPPVAFSNELHPSKLGRVYAAGTDVADFALLHKVMERLHGFFHGGRRIESMDLEEIDVRGIEPFEGSMDLVKNGSTR